MRFRSLFRRSRLKLKKCEECNNLTYSNLCEQCKEYKPFEEIKNKYLNHTFPHQWASAYFDCPTCKKSIRKYFVFRPYCSHAGNDSNDSNSQEYKMCEYCCRLSHIYYDICMDEPMTTRLREKTGLEWNPNLYFWVYQFIKQKEEDEAKARAEAEELAKLKEQLKQAKQAEQAREAEQAKKNTYRNTYGNSYGYGTSYTYQTDKTNYLNDTWKELDRQRDYQNRYDSYVKYNGGYTPSYGSFI